MSGSSRAATRTTSWKHSSRPWRGRCAPRQRPTRVRAGSRAPRAPCDERALVFRRAGDTVMSPRVVVLDYGSGNLRSAQRALERVGAQVEVTADADAALECDGLAVPGVGAFAACMAG